MGSSDDVYSEHAVQLLDIVYDLHGGDKHYPYENIPFSSSEDGGITLSPTLKAELGKHENQHLMGWAHENIKSLF